jgi:acyl-CoA synthetase (NDP forming)
MITDEERDTFNKLFYPESIAVIGVSTKGQGFGIMQLSALSRNGYRGKLYPVNPHGGEFFGLKTYPNVREIPENVDLAIITVPAHVVPETLEDCLAKRIKVAEILSSGFSEIGEEGRRLEEQLVNIAAKGIRIVGPNCFGVHCPASGVSIPPGIAFTKESGTVGLIAQSGQFSLSIVLQSQGQGVRFSKIISYGNACDLNEADFLEYLAEDQDTKIIQVYNEGTKEGHRFLEIVRRTSKTKPVILLKAGLSRAGRRAASSHTGSLGGEKTVWNAFFKQSGAISVDSLEDLIDATIAFKCGLRPHGPRVAILSGGGGGSVIGADLCERWELTSPVLSQETQAKLRPFFPSIGSSMKNPIDMANPMPPPQLLRSTLEILAMSGEIDSIVIRGIYLSANALSATSDSPSLPEEYQRDLQETPIVTKERFAKPVIVVLEEEVTASDMLEFEADRRRLRDYYLAHNIPVYSTLERAIRALSHVVKHQEWVAAH